MATEVVELRGVQVTNERFQRILTAMGRKLMAEIGFFLMARIKTRTSAGKDVDGTPFAPYSAKYAFFRQKKGRPIDKVDLFFTGSMMSSMTMEASQDSVRVFFMPTQDRTGTSNPAKAFWLNKKRQFFAISDQDQQDITRVVLDALKGAGF